MVFAPCNHERHEMIQTFDLAPLCIVNLNDDNRRDINKTEMFFFFSFFFALTANENNDRKNQCAEQLLLLSSLMCRRVFAHIVYMFTVCPCLLGFVLRTEREKKKKKQ